MKWVGTERDYLNWSVVKCCFLDLQIRTSLSSLRATFVSSWLVETFHLWNVATRTWIIRVRGLPPGSLCRYNLVPHKKTNSAIAIVTAGMPNPRPHPMSSWIYVSTAKPVRVPMQMLKYHQLKNELLYLFSSRLPSSNWSAPNACKQGLKPPCPKATK